MDQTVNDSSSLNGESSRDAGFVCYMMVEIFRLMEEAGGRGPG